VLSSIQIHHFIAQLSNRVNKLEQMAFSAGFEENLSPSELNIIERIGLEGSEKMSNISSALNITLATLTVACDKLEAKGFVCRQRDEHDKRTVSITLTPKGIVAYNFHLSFLTSLIDVLNEGLSEAEIELLYQSIEKINRHFAALMEA